MDREAKKSDSRSSKQVNKVSNLKRVGLIVLWLAMFICLVKLFVGVRFNLENLNPSPRACFDVEVIKKKEAQDKCDLYQKRRQSEEEKLHPQIKCWWGICIQIPPSYKKPLYHHTFEDIISNYYCSQVEESLIITNYKRDEEWCGEEVVIPDIIDGKTVVAIWRGAFWLNYREKEDSKYLKLRRVHLPKRLVWIDDLAFASNHLTWELILPKSLKAIGEWGFGNNDISTVKFNSELEVIESKAFRNNKLSHIELPESIFHIQKEAFLGNQIESVHLPVNLNDGVDISPDSLFDPSVLIE